MTTVPIDPNNADPCSINGTSTVLTGLPCTPETPTIDEVCGNVDAYSAAVAYDFPYCANWVVPTTVVVVAPRAPLPETGTGENVAMSGMAALLVAAGLVMCRFSRRSA